jgi:hypothetical protein
VALVGAYTQNEVAASMQAGAGPETAPMTHMQWMHPAMPCHIFGYWVVRAAMRRYARPLAALVGLVGLIANWGWGWGYYGLRSVVVVVVVVVLLASQ